MHAVQNAYLQCSCGSCARIAPRPDLVRLQAAGRCPHTAASGAWACSPCHSHQRPALQSPLLFLGMLKHASLRLNVRVVSAGVTLCSLTEGSTPLLCILLPRTELRTYAAFEARLSLEWPFNVLCRFASAVNKSLVNSCHIITGLKFVVFNLLLQARAHMFGCLRLC